MKKIALFALMLAVVLSMTACSRNSAPSVTPSNTPNSTMQPENNNGATDHNGNTVGGSGVGADENGIMDNIGDAVGDTARGIGNAARDITR